MTSRIYIAVIGLMAMLSMSGCTTVKIPKLDFVKFPEFLEEARNFDAYPKVSEAPKPPNDLRSAEDWDQAAREIMETRGTFSQQLSRNVTAMSPAEFQALKAQVRAYKLDDPQ